MTTTGTAGDTPRVIDVLIAIPVMRDEADLWESVAKAMGRRGVSPLDAVHLMALTGLQLQLQKNNRLDDAAAVAERVAALAQEIGVWSTPAPEAEGKEQTNDTVSADT